MKVFKENITYTSNIMVVKEERFDFNEFPFHYHAEFELIYIMQGSGQRFVGDSIADFQCGLYLFGPNLPHTFYNKHLSKGREIHQIVIQFDEHFLGKGFFDRPPFRSIRTFLDNAARGYLFGKEITKEVGPQLIDMTRMNESGAIAGLLNLLNKLSGTTDFEYISSPGYKIKPHQIETERMSAVYDYIIHQYREPITLKTIAAVACMSPEAFCRYFKKYTRKTFSTFLLELRIGNACRLLQEDKMSIRQIKAHCGFNNLSYFNRQFKLLVQKTPIEYRELYTEGAMAFQAAHKRMIV